MSTHETINFCPRCSAPVTLQERYSRLRPVCPACGWVHFADPKVAAAVVVTRESDGKILLVRRANPPHAGKWTLPAGFVDADEDPARAAERECREETGLQAQVTGIFDIVFGREHSRGADFVIFYRAALTGGTLRPGDDADAAQWFHIGDLPEIAFQSTKFILEKIRQSASNSND
jgi:8-oxo-dGTP diphosphatase